MKIKRHKCPPDVQLQVKINGQLVVGPIMGEELAYIAKYSGGYDEPLDLMQTCFYGHTDKMEVLVQYFPRKKR